MMYRNLLLFAFLLFATAGISQNTLKGVILDDETGTPVPFASIKIPSQNKATQSNEDGLFELPVENTGFVLEISCIGYRSLTDSFPKGPLEYQRIRLKPQVQEIREITIRPDKYKNKNNPTVALIKQVIDHRDENRVEKRDFFYEEQYEKVLVGLSNMPEKLQNRKVLQSWKFAFENSDTTKLDGKPVLPFYLQENLIDFYSKNDPERFKKYVKATQTVEFPGYLDQDGINQALQYVNQEINLYDNYVVMLTDHFMSPIANGAPAFYRYYPLDTIQQNGTKIIRLAFYPRNKNDMLLQGELHVAPDNNYAVTKAIFGVNPRINLNWVNVLELDQEFEQLPSGKWVLSREYYKLEFSLKEKGMGVYGERLVTHEKQDLNTPIPDSLFQHPLEVIYLPESNVQDSSFWKTSRHEDLSHTEAMTYVNMDSIQNTKLFKNTAKAMLIAFVGYVPVGKSLEIGPLNTFVAFNEVEGDRLRFGGRTASTWSTKFRLEGYAAYGFRDEQWKYGAGAVLALNGTAHNQFPFNLLRFKTFYDVRIPGQSFLYANTNSILTSFVRGTNDRFLYTKYYGLQYEKEFINHFSYILGVENQELTPAGALDFRSTETGEPTYKSIATSNAFIELRYAPNELFMETSTNRQLIDYRYITTLRYNKAFSGMMGSGYDFHELRFSLRKWSNTPPFGFNIMILEAGGIWGKAPYPLLTIHRANQTYFYQRNGYNLMNFMEFISDRYVSLTMDHDFYGFFLNKIPLLNKLKLREAATLKVLYGSVSKTNQPVPGSNVFFFPQYPDGTPISYTLEKKPYIEASIGLGNIFRVLRIDVVRRFSYLDHPGAPKYGIRGQIQLYF
ncbi:MAG: DUF5686 family protein [Saprospiraceae bacterium]